MAKSALLEDAPPDGFEDSPPDGFDESPAVTAQRPKVSVASPVVRPLDPGAKPLSPAMTAYQRSLDSFLSGDRAGAEIHSKEALKIDPNLTEASRMLDRLAFDQKQGTKNMAQETPSLTFPQQNGQTNLSNAAEWLSKNINKAKPPLPGISGNLPKSLGELIQSVQIGSFPGVEKVEKLSSGIKSKATGIIEPKPVPRGGMPANVFGKLIMAPLEAGLGIPPGTLSKIERQVGEQAISENGQRVIQEAISMFPFTPNEFQQWIGADAPSVFAPKVAMALVEKFPVLGKKFNLADIGPVLKEFITTKNVKVPLGKEELKAFYTFGRESLDPWIYEQLTGKSPSEVKAMLKDALAGKPVFLEKRVPRFGSDSVRKTISAEGPIPGETINGTPPSIIGQDVAPIDKTGQPSYPINNEPSGVTPSSPGGIVPGGRDSGPVVQGSSPDSPPDGFIDGSRVSVGQEIKPQEPSQQSGPERVPTVKPSTENVALPPSPTVQDIGQSAQPQSETTPQPPVEPSAPSGKVKNKKIKKQKQLTPIEGLASVIPRRSTFPILTGFNVKNGVASATDMTSYLETKVDLPDGHYKIVGKNVEKSGLDPAQFPISPKIGNKIGTVDRSDLIRNFDRVEKASSDDEQRYVLQSVNLKSENGKAYLTSTDGRRLSTSPLDSAKLPDGSYIIPANLGVGKSLKALSGDTLDVSIINSSDGTPEAISFTSPNGRVVSRLIYGKFPNFDQVIPEPTEQIVLSKSVLENALKELKPYTKGDKRNTVIVNRDGDNISLRVINPDNKRDKTISVKGKTIGGNFAKIKAGSIVMPMQMNEHLAKLGIELGPGHLGGFNLGYLQDAVSSVSGNEVYLGRLDDPLKPIVVRGKPLEEKDITGGNSVVKAQNDMNEEFRKERVWKEIAKANEEERPRIVAQLENEDVVWALGRVKMLPEGTGGNLKSLLEKRSNESTVIRGKPLDKNVTIKKAKQRGPGKGVQASTGGSNIESFEQNTGPIYYSQLQRTIEQKMPNTAPVSMVKALIDPSKGNVKIESFEQLTPKEQEQTFKMAEEVRGLVSKYAVRVGEKYVPRRAEGAYYPETQNIRLKSLNDLSVAVHEITHSIDDAKAGTSKKIIAAKDRETIAGLTEIYATYYAPGKSDHTVRKRIVEGLATLIQKTAETPTIMREKYGPLLDKFIKPGGRYYDKNYTDLLTDSHGIVGKFQELDKLGQVGAFVTSKFQQKEARSSFLSVWDKIRTEVSDSIWPVEKAAKKAGIERTASDPSLWMRANQAIVGNIENNMVGSKGFWIPTKEGGFRQVSEKNFSDLLVSIGDDHLEDRFGWWLIARDSYFEWKRLDKIAAEIEGLKEKIQLLPETMTPELIAEKKGLIRLLSDKQVEHEEFLQRLNREPLGRDTFERAYIENRDTFQKWGDLFDTFTAANLDLVEMSDLATPEQLDVLRQKEGYAPKKRDIYDDIIGSEKQQLPTVQVGKTKLSSMMARKGSSLSYVNPLYSVVKDHAEIMRKSMKQMVYNKMLNIAPEWPEIFQPVELKVVVDKTTGKMSFPQEKDQNIIMSRGPGGTRHPLLVGRDMKKVIDDVLSFHDLHIAERVLRKAARMFSQGTTGLYPQFVLTNIVMDLPTAMANTRTKMIPVFDALKDLNKALLQNNTPEAKYAREWFASHGERQSLAGWQNEDPDDFFRLLQNEKHWIMRATKSAAGVVDFLSIPAKYSEIMSRLTEYVRSRKAGKPWIVAMEDSARVTTPFVHMGRWGGGTWMKTLVKSISFFNPGIQALDQFVRSAGQKDTQKRLLFVMAATAVASVAGMAWIMKHATQEQKDQYKDLEGKSLTNYAWFPASDGKNLIKIRVDQQYGWLAALVNLAIGETVFGMDYKFRDYADAATSLVPDQFDISHPVMALLNWIPQIVKPSLEVAFDQRTFPTVRPLTPRGLEHVAPGLRSTETTSPVAKELGKRLDLSPIAIDHLIEGYLGRTARFGTGRFSSMKMNPFFQDWYFTSGRNLQDFYDTRERWQYINKEFKTNPKEVSAEDKKSYFHNGPIIKKIEARLDVIREYQKTGKPLKGEELYRNRHAILEDIAKLK